MQFRLPHFVERSLQNTARLRIKQSRSLGPVVHMPVFTGDVAGIAKTLRDRDRILVALCATLGLLAEKFSVAEPQHFLFHAEFIGTRREALCFKISALRLQSLAVDDDLPLACEVGWQGLLNETLHPDALRFHVRRPPQDEAFALGEVRVRGMIVRDAQTHNHVIAFGKSQGRKIQRLAICPVTRIAFALQFERLLRRLDVFACSLGMRDRQMRRLESVIIVCIKYQIPSLLTGCGEAQSSFRRADDDFGRPVGDNIESMQGLRGGCEF